MESFLASCVQHYLKLRTQSSAGNGAGRKKNKAKQSAVPDDDGPLIDPAKFLTVVPTPFLNESEQRGSPQGSPTPNDPNAVTCPWRVHRCVPGSDGDQHSQ